MWPERKPSIGFYDEGDPEVADWQIKYALEHGIQGFIYCWYRQGLSPKISEALGHTIQALLRSKYIDMFTFSIMWENSSAGLPHEPYSITAGVKDSKDMMDNLLPYWIEKFFKHPSYLKIDNKPVLFVFAPGRLHRQLGGPGGTKKVFEQMRAECRRHGFNGLIIIGCVHKVDKNLLEEMGRAGWDASAAYGVWGDITEQPVEDIEGWLTVPHRAALQAQKDVWLGKKRIGALPDIVTVMMGWDNRPYPWQLHRWRMPYWAGCSVDNYESALRAAKKIVDATPGDGLDKRLIILDNWNEAGEGHYIQPCAGFGFGFLDAVRRVFCDDKEPCIDIIPQDVGLEPPDRLYRPFEKILYEQKYKRRRAVRDNLVLWWSFDEEDIAFDSATGRFHGVKQDFESPPGIKGWFSMAGH